MPWYRACRARRETAASRSEAIRQELQGRGVGLVDVASANTYRVEGIVKLGEAKDGKQPILIEWQVKDPKGKKLGTVSQRNENPGGSLDGEWGATAQQAAGAAVQGIVKLLPQKNCRQLTSAPLPLTEAAAQSHLPSRGTRCHRAFTIDLTSC